MDPCRAIPRGGVCRRCQMPGYLLREHTYAFAIRLPRRCLRAALRQSLLPKINVSSSAHARAYIWPESIERGMPAACDAMSREF